MEVFGLEYLTSKISAYTPTTLPHSILLVGKEGSGKHVISAFIANTINLPLIDISNNLSEELISNIYLCATPRLYQVDLREITANDQNILLKLFEEPPTNAFVVLLANNTFNVLPTLLNRGILFSINNYDKNTLKKYCEGRGVEIDSYYLGGVVETPGDIQKVYSYNVVLPAIKELADKMIDKLHVATFANTLTIINKLNFKDEYDKIDVDFFLKTLYVESAEKFMTGEKNASTIFSIVHKTLNRVVDTRFNKRLLISNMLCEMWEGVRK